MNAACKISVVMSVHNDEATLTKAMESVLTQDGQDFEFIVVIDGATDGSRAIAERFARTDERVRVIVRENRGLTESLIEGCTLARGEFIARQDADDMSLPGRFRKQLELLETDPEITLAGCGTRFVTPEEHELYHTFPDVIEAMAQVSACRLSGLQILSGHGSAMFRTSAYKQVGGYRKEFYFGQDVDLWIRLLEIGTFRSVDEILYTARLSPRGISSIRRPEQIALAALSLETARARRKGVSEEPFLLAAAQLPDRGAAPSKVFRSRIREAQGLYFFGSCLSKRGNAIARQYFLRSLAMWPLQIRSWYGLIRVWSSH